MRTLIHDRPIQKVTKNSLGVQQTSSRLGILFSDCFAFAKPAIYSGTKQHVSEVISIWNIVISDIPESETRKYSFMMRIDGKKEYILACNSISEKQAWMSKFANTLKNAIEVLGDGLSNFKSSEVLPHEPDANNRDAGRKPIKRNNSSGDSLAWRKDDSSESVKSNGSQKTINVQDSMNTVYINKTTSKANLAYGGSDNRLFGSNPNHLFKSASVNGSLGTNLKNHAYGKTKVSFNPGINPLGEPTTQLFKGKSQECDLKMTHTISRDISEEDETKTHPISKLDSIRLNQFLSIQEDKPKIISPSPVSRHHSRSNSREVSTVKDGQKNSRLEGKSIPAPKNDSTKSRANSSKKPFIHYQDGPLAPVKTTFPGAESMSEPHISIQAKEIMNTTAIIDNAQSESDAKFDNSRKQNSVVTSRPNPNILRIKESSSRDLLSKQITPNSTEFKTSLDSSAVPKQYTLESQSKQGSKSELFKAYDLIPKTSNPILSVGIDELPKVSVREQIAAMKARSSSKL